MCCTSVSPGAIFSPRPTQRPGHSLTQGPRCCLSDTERQTSERAVLDVLVGLLPLLNFFLHRFECTT